MKEGDTSRFGRVMGRFTEIFGLSRAVAVMALVLTGLFLLAAFFWFFHSAPPHTITITTGPQSQRPSEVIDPVTHTPKV